jgi:hypothetical protein
MKFASGRHWRMLFWVTLIVSTPGIAVPAGPTAAPQTYYVDCSRSQTAGDGSLAAPLQTVDQVNALKLGPGSRVLFKRGSLCRGGLRMQGSGSAGHPIQAAAYGAGTLPRIEAQERDQAAFRLFNQQYWEISSLDIGGGTEYGVSISGDTGTLRHLYLRDVRVHDVRGKLKQKESSLDQGLISAAVDGIDLGGKRYIPAIVHAQHHGDHGGVVGFDIALHTFGHGASVAAVHRVTRYAGIDEANVQRGITGENEILDEFREQPLGGNAVSVEDDGIALVQRELLAGRPGGHHKNQPGHLQQRIYNLAGRLEILAHGRYSTLR